MNKIPLFIATVLLLTMNTCEELRPVQCDSCYEEIPSNIYLEVELSVEMTYRLPAIVTIYEGPIEDNVVLDVLETNSRMFRYPALKYKDYTFTVEYEIKDRNYIVVASARPEIIYDDSSCSVPCYYVINNYVDLRLRYE